jgi:proline iminopeptidase
VHRRFFDPAYWRIVIFDQRGGGRSTPLGETQDNSPDQLVADIERLRHELGIGAWIVFGGSWGSTLALAYAEAHPARCRALVLRGIFLCRKLEIDWFLYGLRHVFPEAWRAFSEFLPPAERHDLSPRRRSPPCRCRSTRRARSPPPPTTLDSSRRPRASGTSPHPPTGG